MVVTTLYTCASVMLLVFLSAQVIVQRRKHKVGLGDGDIVSLQRARSAHSNATEYIPITLLLLLLLELNSAPLWLLHLCGLALLTGRMIHAYAMLQWRLKYRVRGMQITFATLAALVAANLLALTGLFGR